MAYTLTTSQDIQLPNSSALRPSLPVTIAAWVKPTGITSNQSVFNNNMRGGTAYAGVELSLSATGGLSTLYGNNTGASSSGRRSKAVDSVLTAGVWQHVACCIRGATDADIYLAGVDVGGSYSGTGGSLAYRSDNGSIGHRLASGSTARYAGDIAEVAFWNVSLSAAEIAAMATGVSPLRIRPDALVGYWPLYQIIDLGPQHLNGSLIGSPVLAANHAPVGPPVAPFFGEPVRAAAIGGAFTGDAVLLKAQAASLSSDAILRQEIAGVLAADAIAFRAQAFAYTQDAALFGVQTAAYTQDGVLMASMAGGLDLDAVITDQVIISDSFTTDGIIKGQVASSLTQDAVFKTQVGASLAQDAILLRTSAASATANADIKRAIAGTYSASAVIKRAGAVFSFTAEADIEFFRVTFRADAVIGTNLVHNRWQHHRLRDHFGLESDLYVGLSQAIGPWGEGTPLHFVVEDLISRMTALESSSHKVNSFTGDSYLLGPGEVVDTGGGVILGVYFSDAMLAATVTSSFTAGAYKVRGGNFTVAAWIRYQGALSADASLV